MFEEPVSRRARWIGAIGLILISVALVAALYLLATKFGRWAH